MDVNYSDDELGYLAISAYLFVKDALPDRITNIFLKTMKRSWSIV